MVTQMKTLQEKIRALPHAPGCYLFKNETGGVIYVGKSKDLKNRVSSYFHDRDQPLRRLGELVAGITDLEIQLTDTETQALLLEWQLIKKYRPRHNRAMMRDKNFYHLVTDPTAERPTLKLGTEAPDGYAKYGLFSAQSDVENNLLLLANVFHLPNCQKKLLRPDNRPCLRRELGQCPGPCCTDYDSVAYKSSYEAALTFLGGGDSPILAELDEAFTQAKSVLAFEEAAKLHDQVTYLEGLRRRLLRLGGYTPGQTAFIFLRAYRAKEFSLFYVMGEEVLGRWDFSSAAEAKFSQVIRDHKTDQGSKKSLPTLQNILQISADRYFYQPSPHEKLRAMDLKKAYRRWQAL